jgi:acyl-CoA thioester hydrolase
MLTTSTQVRVRYADTDQMGYVYYGNYAAYYEIARVDALRQIGISYKALEDEGVMLPVLENHSHYLAPAGFDELLTIKLMVRQLPTVRLVCEYEIYNPTGQLIHTGRTVLVFMRKDTRRPCRPPAHVVEIFRAYFPGPAAEQP